MSGVAPGLPSSGWKVLYKDAFKRWLDGNPSTLAIAPVTEWIRECERFGPPIDARRVEEDRYVYRIELARVVVEYLVIVKDFR